jgi:lipid-A-disaccharide synthase-like uncharacterized protein
MGNNGDAIQILGDNQGALALAKNLYLDQKSNHIDIFDHFIRDEMDKGMVVIR